MLSTEFVYLICQDKRTNRVVTLEDNRFKLMSAPPTPQNEFKSSLNEAWNTIVNLFSITKDNTPPAVSNDTSIKEDGILVDSYNTNTSSKSKYD